MKYKLVSESNHQKVLVQQASSFEDSKCVSPGFINELVERIVQRITEKSNYDLNFYTINEVASLSKVSRATVERRIKDEELKTYRFGGNIRIRKRVYVLLGFGIPLMKGNKMDLNYDLRCIIHLNASTTTSPIICEMGNVS